VIDVELVRALVHEQFPEWSTLPIRAVLPGGNDHRTFRLGDDLSVRLPSAPGYVPQVAKEQEWLPRLAPGLPLPIPAVRGVGVPTEAFPRPWSVYDWIAGDPLPSASVDDPVRFAIDLALFFVALRGADTTGAPPPGPHSAWRGCPPSIWDDEMQSILLRVHGRERDRASGIWRDALEAPPAARAVWFHGDVAANNLLVRDGALSAVIDFGCAGVGDPACDTVAIWTFLEGSAVSAFREVYDVDEATWARGRGWAIWKALIMITNEPPEQRAFARRVLDRVLSDRS
jgi:aminoglycoside phosphotransferase (APT) family kinase protein